MSRGSIKRILRFSKVGGECKVLLKAGRRSTDLPNFVNLTQDYAGKKGERGGTEGNAWPGVFSNQKGDYMRLTHNEIKEGGKEGNEFSQGISQSKRQRKKVSRGKGCKGKYLACETKITRNLGGR